MGLPLFGISLKDGDTIATSERSQKRKRSIESEDESDFEFSLPALKRRRDGHTVIPAVEDRLADWYENPECLLWDSEWEFILVGAEESILLILKEDSLEAEDGMNGKRDPKTEVGSASESDPEDAMSHESDYEIEASSASESDIEHEDEQAKYRELVFYQCLDTIPELMLDSVGGDYRGELEEVLYNEEYYGSFTYGEVIGAELFGAEIWREVVTGA
jgi:hypothetical protein